VTPPSASLGWWRNTPVPDHPAVDLRTPKTIHVIGIGGAGMSAIGSVLAAMGHRVSGSDLKESAGLERLRAEGVDVYIGHTTDNLRADLDYVTISTAIPERNLEVIAARERGIPVLRRADMLGAIAATRRTVAVAGTHGKTTTASMLALVLTQADMHPSFIIGGDVNEIGSGAIWSDGEWFVVEADESDGTFVELPSEAVVLTNVEPDHLEFHGSYEALLVAFDRFLVGASGPKLVCADDEVSAQLGDAHGAHTYGTSPSAEFRMEDLALGRWGASFQLARNGEPVGVVELPLAGVHNARNACAAVAMGMLLGAPFEAARAALAKFGGVARRFEYRGEVDGITFIDDYAHLPTEAAAALAAARSGGWRRVVCVFQPHRYSRTASLWRDFGDAFVDADVVAITDVYAAGETPRPGVSGKLVVQSVLDAHPWARVAYLPHRADVVTFLRSELRPGDLCLTLGAGDLTSLPDELQELLRREPAA
jgi:UDP-N-acetylmuramate--alanine ligase